LPVCADLTNSSSVSFNKEAPSLKRKYNYLI
jgi:hypothetical protein